MEFPLTRKAPSLFILIDVDRSGLEPYADFLSQVDDLSVYTLEELQGVVEPEYYDGTYHILDTLEAAGELSRWKQLVWASLGVRVFSNSFSEESPLYAGPLPDPSKIRRVFVDATFADTRASFVFENNVDYIGRTKLDPRNVFVLDFDPDNPLFDPSKDPVLAKLYDSLTDDWWGSCGFVAAENVDDLESFFNAVPTPIPLAFSNGARSKLKYLGLEFVDASVPDGSERYGIDIRDRANRLSYKLSEPEAVPEVESSFTYKI